MRPGRYRMIARMGHVFLLNCWGDWQPPATAGRIVPFLARMAVQKGRSVPAPKVYNLG